MTPRSPFRHTAFTIFVVMSLVAVSGIIAMVWPPSSPGRGVVNHEGLYAQAAQAPKRQKAVDNTVAPLVPSVGELGWDASEISAFRSINTGEELPRILQCRFVQDVGLSAPGVSYTVKNYYSDDALQGVSVLIDVANTEAFATRLVNDLYGCEPGPTGRFAWDKPKAMSSRQQGAVQVRQWMHPVSYERGKSGVVYRTVLSTSQHIEVLSVLVPKTWSSADKRQAESAHTSAVSDAVSKLAKASSHS